MDPEFQRALTIVLGVGSIMMGIGTIVLALVFRSFGGAKPRVGLMAGLVMFLLACSVLLFALSYAAQR